MPSNLYATIILMVTLSVDDTIRHKNTVCYYPNYLLTWQRVLCVYLNVVVAFITNCLSSSISSLSNWHHTKDNVYTTCLFLFYMSHVDEAIKFDLWCLVILLFDTIFFCESFHAISHDLHVNRTQAKNIIYDIFIIHVFVYWSFSCNYIVDVHFFYIVI